jgi:hypothetical protein
MLKQQAESAPTVAAGIVPAARGGLIKVHASGDSLRRV